MIATFTVPSQPQGKARARTVRAKDGRVMSFTPEKTVIYENLVKLMYKQSCKDKGWFNKEPLWMMIDAYYPIPKSTSKKDLEKIKSKELWPTKKPDADNIAKAICDALNGVAYQDDTQIVELIIKKSYAEEPRVEVCITDKEG